MVHLPPPVIGLEYQQAQNPVSTIRSYMCVPKPKASTYHQENIEIVNINVTVLQHTVPRYTGELNQPLMLGLVS